MFFVLRREPEAPDIWIKSDEVAALVALLEVVELLALLAREYDLIQVSSQVFEPDLDEIRAFPRTIKNQHFDREDTLPAAELPEAERGHCRVSLKNESLDASADGPDDLLVR